MADSPPERTPATIAHGALWAVVGALTLAFALTALVPWEPAFPPLSLDSSWGMVLHEAYARGWRFGSDVIFTYGPFGFISSLSYHPATGNTMLALWVLFAAGFWAILFALARKLVSSALVALPLLAMLLAVASIGIDSFFLAYTALVPIVYVALGRKETPLLHVTAAFVGLVALVKFSFLVPGALLVASVAADHVVRTRRPPRAIFAFLGAALAGWLASGQRLVDVPAYVSTSLELARGYGPAMPLDGEIKEVYIWVGLFLAFVAFTVAIARPRPWFLAAGFAAWSLVVFKAGFVRHDAHAVAAASTLLLTMIAYGAFVAPKHGRVVRALFACVLVATTLAFSSIIENYYRIRFTTFVWSKLSTESVSDAKAAVAILTGDDPRPVVYKDYIDRMAARSPLPQVPGSVDIFQALSGLAIAHGMDYRPRPVFQSYAAFSERLANYNADFLKSDSAPQFVFVHVDSIDYHTPLSEDAAAWPILLSRYDLRDLRGGFVLLERSSTPKSLVVTPIATQSATLRGTYNVPDVGDDLVWVEVSVRRTALGWLREFLFQIPPPILQTELQDGTRNAFRLPVAMAKGGFILSPSVANELGVARAFAGKWPRSERVARVSLTTVPGAEAYYATDYTLTFKRIHVDALGEGARLPSSIANLLRLASTGRAPAVELRSDPTGQPIVFAHAPATLTLDAPAGARRLKVRFGIVEEAWTGKGSTGGVEFRISTGSGSAARTLWSRYLDPLAVPADRGTQEATIELPGTLDGPLRLETLPGAESAWDWSYWAGAEPD